MIIIENNENVVNSNHNGFNVVDTNTGQKLACFDDLETAERFQDQEIHKRFLRFIGKNN